MKRHKILSFGKNASSRGARFEAVGYEPETQYAVIRSSICTGEKVAGFKDKKDGRFTEVMLIRSPEDLREFRETYNLDKVKTEY